MLRALQEFFESNMRPSGSTTSEEDREHALRLATAALLIEMSRADFTEREVEREAIEESLKRFFDLTPEETDTLRSLAEKEADASTSLHPFTSLINDHYLLEQKITVVEMLWRVCYADGHKDMHEEHLVRKIANLLYVPHQDFIRARHRVEEEMR
jgi:uncharacterized tellurite resistance protein B-like protein